MLACVAQACIDKSPRVVILPAIWLSRYSSIKRPLIHRTPQVLHRLRQVDPTKARLALRMPKRSRHSTLAQEPALTTIPLLVPPFDHEVAPPTKRRASQRKASKPAPPPSLTNPDENPSILDGPQALRASPDADEEGESLNVGKLGMKIKNQIKEEDDDELPSLTTGGDSDSPLSEISDADSSTPNTKLVSTSNTLTRRTKEKGINAVAAEQPKKLDAKQQQFLDPEADGEEEADEEEIQAALSRPPPIHSDYLPLPWKGRLGYVRYKTFIQSIDINPS